MFLYFNFLYFFVLFHVIKINILQREELREFFLLFQLIREFPFSKRSIKSIVWLLERGISKGIKAPLNRTINKCLATIKLRLNGVRARVTVRNKRRLKDKINLKINGRRSKSLFPLFVFLASNTEGCWLPPFGLHKKVNEDVKLF